ncbi:calpain large subunit, domain III [Ancylostoma duodenale]|uniref:Calpain large subunit, domain III n=1 Tax=Ancylostoma duodenale TaxID=51022 RepID=A0A0C2H5D8_9BILA|nr:calpain large subunit, domain III [Ancylostoma duodenale]
MNEISEISDVQLSELQKHKWEEQAHEGEWNTTKGTAGGCDKHPDTYAQNPQFGAHFIVTEESVEQDGKCTVIVAVLQKYRREMRTIGKDRLAIGFAVYQSGKKNLKFELDIDDWRY